MGEGEGEGAFGLLVRIRSLVATMSEQTRSTVVRARGTRWAAREQQMRAMRERSIASAGLSERGVERNAMHAWTSLHADDRVERRACEHQ